MKRFVRDVFTDSTNVTFDLFRILGVASLVIGLGLSLASFIYSKPFDLQAFGTGVGILLVAVAGALRINDPPATTTTLQSTTVTETTK